MVKQEDVIDEMIEFVDDESEDIEDLLQDIGDMMYSPEQQSSFKALFAKYQHDPV